MRLKRLCWIACVIHTATSACMAANPVFMGLGRPQGYASTAAFGVSADGSVVAGTAYIPFGNQRAFRWSQAEGMVALGTLPGRDFSTGWGISGNGAIVVGQGDSATGQHPALRWVEQAPPANIGLLGGLSAEAHSVNHDGSVVVGVSDYQNGYRAFRWTIDGGMVNLGTISPSTQSFGRAVNGDGSVVVGYWGSSSYRSFRWTPSSGMVDIGTVPNKATSRAYGVSAGGDFVVGISDDVAFRWDAAGGMISLGTLSLRNCEAHAVSSDGARVVGIAMGASNRRAFAWTRAAGLIELNEHLPTLGVNLQGWVLTEVRGISNDGLTLVGTGLRGGAEEAWLLRLDRPCNLADVASIGGSKTPDGQVTIDDLVTFLASFFEGWPLADIATLGGLPGVDDAYTADDIVAFLAAFFAACD